MLRALLPLLLFAQVALAQIQFTATANSTSVQAGETVEVTFTFIGAATGVPTPQPGDLLNLDLIGGPSTSTQTSIINGKMSSSKSFTYYFRAKAPGKATIGPVQVNYKRRNYTTSPIQILVLASGQRASSGQKEEVFIQVIPDRREAFLGEQIVLTYKLYFSTSVYAPEFKELPKSTGFWTEEFEMPSQLVPRDEVLDGQSYKSVIVRKVALFATTVGELTVEPLTAMVQVERRNNGRGNRNDPFNDPFFTFNRRREAIEVSCRPIKLNIKPLPEVGKPTGEIAVGKFSISARLDKTECETNDAVTLSVLVRGNGNIKTLPKPSFIIPPDFEAFDPKTTENIKRGPDRISGSKSFEIVLIPRAPGMQSLPSVTFPYFDPVTETYEVAKTAPMVLNVVRGSGRAGDGSLPVASKREVQTIGQDIAYLKTSVGELVKVGQLPHNAMSFWFGLGAPWILLASVLFAVKRQEKAGQSLSARRRRVLKKVRADLDNAEKSATHDQVEDVTRTLINAVQSIAIEWLGIRSVTTTIEDWEEMWRAKGYSDEQWNKLMAANSLSERSRFAGSALSRSEIVETISQVRSVLSELEGAMK